MDGHSSACSTSNLNLKPPKQGRTLININMNNINIKIHTNIHNITIDNNNNVDIINIKFVIRVKSFSHAIRRLSS